MDLGKKIKEARIAKGLSQAALAKLVGCHNDSIFHWEKGKVNNPLPIYIEKLEAVLGVPLKEERDEMEKDNPGS